MKGGGGGGGQPPFDKGSTVTVRIASLRKGVGTEKIEAHRPSPLILFTTWLLPRVNEMVKHSRNYCLPFIFWYYRKQCTRIPLMNTSRLPLPLLQSSSNIACMRSKVAQGFDLTRVSCYFPNASTFNSAALPPSCMYSCSVA